LALLRRRLLEWVVPPRLRRRRNLHKKGQGYPVRYRSEPDIPSGLNGSGGRVEDGRGSLGPVASAPFPIPAHRTGLAELPHPALRLASPRGTRRGSEWQAFEAQQAELLVDHFTREPDGATPCHLMPSCWVVEFRFRDWVIFPRMDPRFILLRPRFAFVVGLRFDAL
jgi:hypothetical protein